jgi:hypothetical protein
MISDSISPAQKLLSFDTINPPGNATASLARPRYGEIAKS